MPPAARLNGTWPCVLQFGSLDVAITLLAATADEETRLLLDGVEACAGFQLLREINVLVSMRNRSCFVWPASVSLEPRPAPRRKRR
jgi:hypothetical protein